MRFLREVGEVLTAMGTAEPALVGALLAMLRPTEEDLRAAFRPGTISRVPGPLPPVVVPGVARTVVRVADAASLRRPQRGFDRRYAAIAPSLREGPIWAAFTYLDAKDRPLASFDGLVLRPERWCWFVKPWELVRTSASSDCATAMDHWID
jgi:hypothetical protein